MRQLIRIAFSFIIVLVLFSCFHETPEALTQTTRDSGNYLIGVFGVPTENTKVLTDAGLNSVLVRESEIEIAKDLPLKKIYVLGVSPGTLKGGLDLTALKNRIRRFNGLSDAYGLYLGDDMTCNRKPVMEKVRSLLAEERVTGSPLYVGLLSLGGLAGKELKNADCYGDFDGVFAYFYPLMGRSGLSLPEMLRVEISMRNRLKDHGRNLFTFVQTHPQTWFKEVVKQNKVGGDALLYPDGQVARMLVDCALAVGGRGFFLYDFAALSAPNSKERVFGVAQAVLEARPLVDALAKVNNVEFFQKPGGFYGSILHGAEVDLVFAFYSDERTCYHPTVNPLEVNVGEVIDPRNYHAVYSYSPLGSTPAAGKVQIPQDHALILIGFREKVSADLFALSKKDLELYADILRNRLDALTANVKKFGITSSPGSGKTATDINEGIKLTLASIDKLNEQKRESWLKAASRLPADGQMLNELYWKKLLTKVPRGEAFNFYYHEQP